MASNKKFAIGLAIAAGLGYVAGVLTAPKSGKETREDIKIAAKNTKKQLEDKLKKLHIEAAKLIKKGEAQLSQLKGRAKTDLKTALDKATKAKNKARDVLSAFHEGEADDVDLDNAVKDLKSSIQALKNYANK